MSVHVAAAAVLIALLVPARASDVSSFPLTQTQSPANASAAPSSPPCRLDLSAELFGGVAAACGAGGGPGSLDRGRCCPVLAAWLFAAHARTALSVPAPAPALAGEGLDGDEGPMVPYDNQRCVDALGTALEKRGVALQRPNATCDTVICFCGIRLHQIGSLRCPAAFAVGAAARNATPTAAVKDLEKSCRNASYAGCSRCVQSLQKVKGNVSREVAGGDRARRMLGLDCQLMGLTWLLAKNKTVYIPTVSAVLRAMLYTAHPTESGGHSKVSGGGAAPPRCSPDQENMPLAVDSLQFEHAGSTSSAAALLRGVCGSLLCLALYCFVWDAFL
ncbi:hypothetical protein CFC21_029130 [Triticum aestivum]|uniref:SPARK domain-containing protein n=4 Tax=Triticinae TaxID=1648030 RepID=A0A3B6DAH0_WHEAT|nr:uncharacterized GPI-anchored protein At4g28100 [Aegilops tauschii subsp. strangulata]XP_044331466.1 uncharacterized GPI-anchored protein At4g28100-like [Triticum aestivum]KAF7015238.1 hypothetical protein CFC21_029130 [Triticum aestivum]